jgi:hypothetical protein
MLDRRQVALVADGLQFDWREGSGRSLPGRHEHMRFSNAARVAKVEGRVKYGDPEDRWLLDLRGGAPDVLPDAVWI